MRLSTGVGIALGITGGAIAALMGAAKEAPAPSAPPPRASATVTSAPTPSIVLAPAPGESASTGAPASSAIPAAIASAVPSAAPPPAVPASVPTDMPTTIEALTKAMVLCDQKKDFDACTRAAFALDLGSTGPADPVQARRFRKIAITHLVTQCEGGWAHACFVLAAKFRAGTELPKNDRSATILEKRAVDLCRHNSAPECPQ